MKEKEISLTTYRRRLNDLRNNDHLLGHREANTEPILFTLLEQFGINTNEPSTFIRQYRGNTSSKKNMLISVLFSMTEIKY